MPFPKPRPDELLRWLVLAGVGTWLLLPFFTRQLIGAGDAVWYANMLGDFVTQWRAGIFPVFVGQTDYAFNGAVYPLRVAPLYQHLAGAIDLLTARRLGIYALQHACVIVCGFTGIFSAYATLVSLAPDRRWTAAALAILYLSCPGLLGTIYTQDLYMTWMAVPFVPVAVYGLARSFLRDDLRAQVCLASGLAALWFAHAPVALWLTMICAVGQGLRLALWHRNGAAMKRVLAGGAIFIGLAHYPFVSLARLETAPGKSSVTASLDEPERIGQSVRSVFPAMLLPVSKHARALSDLQLGYGGWALAFLIGLTLGKRESRAQRFLFGAALFLLLLLLPIPGLNEGLWRVVPDQIVRITYYWPMQRFYLLSIALLVVAAQLAFGSFSSGWRHAAGIGLVLACGWSLWESRQFVAAGRERSQSAEVSARYLRPENRALMNHSYGLFPALPPYFSNGVMHPAAESRLLDRTTLSPLEEPAPAVSSVPFTAAIDANPGILRLGPTLRLEPGHRYELRFEFEPGNYTGVLQLTGSHFFREYALPQSGQHLAFGAGPGNSHSLSLWTTTEEPEEVTLRFIPTEPGRKPADFIPFGRFSLREIPAVSALVEIRSLLPYRATVRTEQSAWLETPRMYLGGYAADVDGQPAEVRVSPAGLAMTAVAAGTHEVTLAYRAPRSVRISYWLTLVGWIALAAGIARAVVRARRATS